VVRKEKKRKEKRKKRNNSLKIVATFVYASSQGQRTHSARTNKENRETVIFQKPLKFNLLSQTIVYKGIK
jgi:hypothetical protein